MGAAKLSEKSDGMLGSNFAMDWHSILVRGGGGWGVMVLLVTSY